MGNNVKKRFTVSLDIETKDLEKQVKSTVGNLKTILSDLGNASDKMGYFKELVGYIGQVDAALTALSSKNKDAFSHMFDGLDTGLKKQLEDLFGVSSVDLGKLDVLREKLSNLAPSSGIKELRNFANEMNELFSMIGAKSPFEDIEDQFSGKATAKHIEFLTNALNEFATVWDGVNKKIQGGFGIGGSGGTKSAAGGGGVVSEIQFVIDNIESKNKELLDAKKRFDKILKEFSDAGKKGISDNYKIELTEESVKNLTVEYDRLQVELESADASSANFYNTLTKLMGVSLKLKRAFGDISSNEGLKQSFMGMSAGTGTGESTLFGLLSRYARTKDPVNSDITKIIKRGDLQGTIDTNNALIKELKASNDVNAVIQKRIDLYDKLKAKLQAYNEEMLKEFDTDEEADDSFAKLEVMEKEIAKLTGSTKRLEEIQLIISDLGEEGAQLDDVLQKLYKTLGMETPDVFKARLESIVKESKAAMAAIENSGDGAGGSGSTGSGSGVGTGSGSAITDAELSSLENTIKSEIASLLNKLDGVLKVEVVQSNTDELNGAIDGIKQAVDKIAGHIDAYYASQGNAKNQAEINVMKNNLAQLFKYVSNFNSKKINGDYQSQELSASILSDGAISVSYGEDGEIPWDRVASNLVANLSKSLLVDVHSHPWAQFGNGRKYANDFFSGSKGDLGAARVAKDLGAQLYSMISGDIMRVLDISKLTDSQLDKFRDSLANVERTYANTPEYSQYMLYKNGGISYYGQDNFEDQHKVTEAFESLMYKAFENIGISKDKVDQEIFQKYNLTDDAQLTQLAERLVLLTQSSQSALNPVERLAEIIKQFSGDVTSANAKSNFEAYKKGEITAAQVFNNLNGENRTISQDTMDSLFRIDTASEISAVESLLTQITSTLDAISTSVSNIDTNTRLDTTRKLDSNISNIVDISNGVIRPEFTKSIKSIFDPLNISEYKNTEVLQQADESIDDFKDSVNDLFRDAAKGKLNIDELNGVLNKFYTAMRHVSDATKQIELYEDRTRNEVEYRGDIATGYLDDKYNELTDFDELQKLLYLLSQAKIDINKTKDIYKDGFSGLSNDDSVGSIVGHLQSIQSSLDSIYGVLRGFTGIEAKNRDSVAYKKPTVDAVATQKEFSEQDMSVLNSILQEIQNIGSYLQAYEQVNTPESDAQDVDVIADLASFIKSKMSQQLASEDTLQLLKSVVDNLYNGELQDSTPKVESDNNETDNITASESTLQAIKSAVDTISKSLSKQAKWALESTLQKTNNILSSKSKESENNGDVSGTGVVDQPSDNGPNDSGKHADEAAVDNDSGSDIKNIEKTKAQLSGMLNAIRSEFKSTKIDMNLEGLTQPQKNVVDGYLDIVAVLKKLQKTSDNVTSDQIQDAQQLYNVLLQQIRAYKTQNNIGITKGNKNTQYGSSTMYARAAQHNTLTNKVSQDSLLSSSSVLTGAMAEYEGAWNRLSEVYRRVQSAPNPTEDDKIAFKEASAECNNLGKEVEKLLKTYDKMHNGSNVVDSIELGDYANREQELRDYVEATYGAKAAIGDFKNNFNELEFTINNGNGTFTKAKVSVDNLRTSIVETQGDTQKATSKFGEFFSAVGKKMNELWVYAWSRLGIDELFQQVRKGVQYMREIDVALTELKKVTNATDETYDQFLQTMSKTASAVGSTVKDLTSSASDWARLNI